MIEVHAGAGGPALEALVVGQEQGQMAHEHGFAHAAQADVVQRPLVRRADQQIIEGLHMLGAFQEAPQVAAVEVAAVEKLQSSAGALHRGQHFTAEQLCQRRGGFDPAQGFISIPPGISLSIPPGIPLAWNQQGLQPPVERCGRVAADLRSAACPAERSARVRVKMSLRMPGAAQ